MIQMVNAVRGFVDNLNAEGCHDSKGLRNRVVTEMVTFRSRQ